MRRPITSTYRLQFGPNLNFEQAAAIVPYLARLGISHVYSSPYLQSAPGSAHGYDVVDPTMVNLELGGDEGLVTFRDALRRAGLGEILDIVPNHMAALPESNGWWRDVLEHGPTSRYARFFDLDWDSPESKLKQRVLLPILGDHYGAELEQGSFQVVRQGARFSLHYYEHDIPIALSSIGSILLRAAAALHDVELESLGAVIGTAQASESSAIRMRLEEVLARPGVAEAVDDVIRQTTSSADDLHELLDLQHYRLAYWRTATDELDYRRFFDVSTLVALRVEDPMVFMETHSLVLKWLTDGKLDGIRIDHVDGLRDPDAYLSRIRNAAPDAYIVAEKILAVDEPLRATWPVEGTTGYDAARMLDELFVHDDGVAQLVEAYGPFIGSDATFADVEAESKGYALALLRTEVRRVGELAQHVCESNRNFRDYTRREITTAVSALLKGMRVYRTYVNEMCTPQDQVELEYASSTALARDTDLDKRLIAFLVDVLLGRCGDDPWHAEFRARFQQLSGAVMAKGVEDTAFYRHAPFLAVNEVGAAPRSPTCGVRSFYTEAKHRATSMPLSMIATSTHDSKRGEDVRSRLSAMARHADTYLSLVSTWWERHKSSEFDDSATAWFAYQTILGAWPVEVDRVRLAMEKSAREAKVRTSWLAIDSEYESALMSFLDTVFEDAAFREEMGSFVAAIDDEATHVTLARTLLKVTIPGVPDTYQGAELMHRVLVDPDNRRPVMWSELRAALDVVESAATFDSLDSGERKLALLTKALRLRGAQPGAFAGGFSPLEVSGTDSDNVVAFVRGSEICAIATLCLGASDASVALPPGTWSDVLRGGTHAGSLSVADFPLSLLAREL